MDTSVFLSAIKHILECCILQLCFAQNQMLSGKKFLMDNPIKSESFTFENDSVCVHRQILHSNMNENSDLQKLSINSLMRALFLLFTSLLFLRR